MDILGSIGQLYTFILLILLFLGFGLAVWAIINFLIKNKDKIAENINTKFKGIKNSKFIGGLNMQNNNFIKLTVFSFVGIIISLAILAALTNNNNSSMGYMNAQGNMNLQSNMNGNMNGNMSTGMGMQANMNNQYTDQSSIQQQIYNIQQQLNQLQSQMNGSMGMQSQSSMNNSNMNNNSMNNNSSMNNNTNSNSNMNNSNSGSGSMSSMPMM